MADTQFVPGWYSDPAGDVTKLRYWDGTQWTEQLMSAPQQPTATVAPGGMAPANNVQPDPYGAQVPQSTYDPYAAPPILNYVQAPTAAPVADKKNQAFISMILGFVNLLGWCLPLVGYPVGIVGLIMGILGLKSSKRTYAIVGIVLCAVTLVLTIVNSVLGVMLFLDSDSFNLS